jgi:hypothetical protein
VFKGAALAHTHYPHPWLRPRLDTDILISPSRSVPAFAALETLGYRREPAISGELVISQAAFSRTDRFGVDHALDVHWRIANWQVVAAVLSHAEISARAVPVPALGPHARAAAPADALLLACLHRAAHHRDSEELLWIYDIHLLASGLSEAEWRHVTAVARRGAVTSLCARGIALAIDRFGTFVPGDVLRELEAQPGAPPEPSAVYLSKHLRLVDGLLSDLRALSTRQRARLVAEHLFPPAAYMRQRYGARSRMSMTVSYIRRIASGLPRWFAPGGDR